MIGVGIPATTTARGIGKVATLADMEPGAVVENGPAFPDVQGGVITTTPTAHAVPQADASGKLDGWVSPDTGKVNVNLDNVTPGLIFGLNQTWQNVTADRAFGATYSNDGSRAILVSLSYDYAASASELTFYIDGTAHSRISGNKTYIGEPQFTEITIPPGSTYKVTRDRVAGNLTSWREYK